MARFRAVAPYLLTLGLTRATLLRVKAYDRSWTAQVRRRLEDALRPLYGRYDMFRARKWISKGESHMRDQSLPPFERYSAQLCVLSLLRSTRSAAVTARERAYWCALHERIMARIRRRSL